jgi:CO/xanthine dehydrogenase FAD-binding subunit
MITIQKYIRAKSLEEAYTLNQNRRNRIVGGMMWTRLGKGSVGTAIDLCDLGLDTIEETDEAFILGAMVSLRALEQHAGLHAYTNGAVKNALKDIVGVQFRNMATVGGSVWGRFGFSDVLTVLLSMDTYVELYKGGIVSLEEFVNMYYDRDLLIRVIIKKSPIKIVYTAMRNQSTDFPVLACAISCVNGEYRASIGARPAKAMLLRDEKKLLEHGITKESAKNFAQYVSKNTPTASNMRGSAAYRAHLTRVLTERAVNELGGM